MVMKVRNPESSFMEVMINAQGAKEGREEEEEEEGNHTNHYRDEIRDKASNNKIQSAGLLYIYLFLFL